MGTLAPASKRLAFVDVLKGLVMVFVVVCHESLGVKKAGIAIPGFLDGFIVYAYTFFMPLMFFLSGLFEERSLAKGTAQFVSGRVRGLIYPFVLWSLLTGSMMLAMNGVINHTISHNPLKWLTTNPIGALWFLETLIVCQLSYALLRYWKLDKRIVTILFLICTVIGAVFYDGNIGTQTLFMMGFFALGACFSKFAFELPNVKPQILIPVAIGLECVHLLIMQLPISPARMIATSVFGSAAYLGFGAAVGTGAWLAPLRSIGTASLAIYEMHTILGACARILLHKVLGIVSPIPNLLFSILTGLFLSWALYLMLNQRFPYLFRWPAAKREDAETVPAPVAYTPSQSEQSKIAL